MGDDDSAALQGDANRPVTTPSDQASANVGVLSKQAVSTSLLAKGRWKDSRLFNVDVAGVVTATGAGLTAAIGAPHIPAAWFGIATFLSALVIYFWSTALTDAANRSRWFAAASVVLALLLVGAYLYHVVGDVPSTYSLTVRSDRNNSGVAAIPLFGEPGGEAQTIETGMFDQNGLIAGQTYSFFECVAPAPDGSLWVRYHRTVESVPQVWWAPLGDLKAATGASAPTLPPC